MKNREGSLILIVLLLGVGCVNKTDLTYTRWTGEGEQPSLAQREVHPVSKVTVQGNLVELLEQKSENFPVEGSFVKRVSKTSEVRFQITGLLNKIPDKVLKATKKMDEKKNIIWTEFQAKNDVYGTFTMVEAPQVKISAVGQIQPLLFVGLRKKNGEMLELQIRQNGRLFLERRLGSAFDDMKENFAWAFPKGPKNSDLTRVSIRRLHRPQDLLSPQVSVQTESPQKILFEQSLELDPSDERFDQVQVYFLASQFSDWLKKNLSVVGLPKIGIVTQVGYPEKTNTAFYYDGLIRIGVGDDLVFSRLAWDPSIVAHEMAHGLIDQIAKLPFEGEGGSLNEGFADTLATFFLESPHLGESSYKKGPYKRTVGTEMHWNQRNGGLYHDSAVVSSLFWTLRKSLGAEKALSLAMGTLTRLSPHSDFNEFRQTLNEQVGETLKEMDLTKTQEVLKDRGLL